MSGTNIKSLKDGFSKMYLHMYRTVFSFNTDGNNWVKKDDLITGRADHACVEHQVQLIKCQSLYIV